MIDAKEAKERLIEGNREYLGAESAHGDISPATRRVTALNGQHPYAIVITCSDSRVIPESIFSAGIPLYFRNPTAANGAAAKIQTQLVVSSPSAGLRRKYTATATAHASTENKNCLSDSPKNIDSV